eukprot:2236613-Amphidinium_carterae.1
MGSRHPSHTVRDSNVGIVPCLAVLFLQERLIGRLGSALSEVFGGHSHFQEAFDWHTEQVLCGVICTRAPARLCKACVLGGHLRRSASVVA